MYLVFKSILVLFSNLYIDKLYIRMVNIHLKEIRSLIDVGTIVINHIFYNNINQE